MASIQVRAAALDDTYAISTIARSHITVWQRVNAGGQVEDVPYDTLSIYERWLHGGPWMSVETCAILLNHLLLGAGIPLVAVTGKGVVGYLEAYHSVEQEPFGKSLHIAHLVADDPDIEKARSIGNRAAPSWRRRVTRPATSTSAPRNSSRPLPSRAEMDANYQRALLQTDYQALGAIDSYPVGRGRPPGRVKR